MKTKLNLFAVVLVVIGVWVGVNAFKRIINNKPIETKALRGTFKEIYEDYAVRNTDRYFVIKLEEYGNSFYLKGQYKGAFYYDLFMEEMNKSKSLELLISKNVDLAENNSSIYGVRNADTNFIDQTRLEKYLHIKKYAFLLIGLFLVGLGIKLWVHVKKKINF